MTDERNYSVCIQARRWGCLTYEQAQTRARRHNQLLAMRSHHNAGSFEQHRARIWYRDGTEVAVDDLRAGDRPIPKTPDLTHADLQRGDRVRLTRSGVWALSASDEEVAEGSLRELRGTVVAVDPPSRTLAGGTRIPRIRVRFDGWRLTESLDPQDLLKV